MKIIPLKWQRSILETAVAKLNTLSGEENQDKSFVSLSADENIPDAEIKQYLEALFWALKQKNLKNIALTGPYGSGKSSILLSFLRKHPEYKFLNVSLASFAPAKGSQSGEGEGTNSQKTVDAAELEQNIVKQIFYSSSPSEIPDSTINRRQGLGRWGLWGLSAMVAGWLLSIIYLCRVGFKRQPYIITTFMRDHETMFDWVAYLIFIVGAVFALHRAILSLRKFVLEKFKFSASSLEIEGQNTKSVLNRNVDELLYFFSVKNYKGLIIEDMDRFRNTDIFSKLRALNILLNNSGKLKKAPLVFIYAIQDDLFSVNDRTKFFDFIIPVVPVVNSSNAGEQLLKLLQNGEHAQNLEKSFVHNIGSYVRDMRMVKNIFNEYVMYKGKIGIDAEFKLLGMIAYKNIYPDDFSALHEGRGIIHDVFANKETTVLQESALMADQIAELEVRITKLEAEITQSNTELNAVYIFKIIETLGRVDLVHIGNDSFSPSELTQQDVFERLRQERSIQYSNSYVNRKNSQTSFSNIETVVDPNRSYADRFSLLQSRETLELAAARRLLEEKKSTLQRQRSLSILQLLKSIPLSKFSQSLIQEPLLVYLLESGAIDELHQLYISNFYEGALKKNDQLFLIDVKTKRRRNFDYQLTNIGEIINRLSNDDFSKAEILNFDLIEHLCSRRSQYKLQLDAFGDQLRIGGDDLWSFVQVSVEQNRVRVFELIPDLWSEFWREVNLKYRDLDERLVTYLSILLLTNTPQRLVELDKDKVLSRFVTVYFIGIRIGLPGNSFTETQRKQIATGIEHLVDLLQINVNSIDAELSITSPVYLNNRYAVALHNFETLVTSHGMEKYDDLAHFGLLTRVERSELDTMIDYFRTHIGEVVDLLVVKDQSAFESPEIALQTLNSADLSVEQKIRFVEGIDFVIAEVGALITESLDDKSSSELVNSLLTSRKFKISWENILDFYQALGLNEQLSNFLNDVNNPFLEANLLNGPELMDEELKRRLGIFAITFAQSERISDDVYMRFISVLPLVSENVLEVTSNSRLQRLIEHDHLSFDQKHVTLIEKDEDLLEAFLRKNLDRLGEVQLTDKQFDSLLTSSLTDDEKRKIFNSLSEERIRNHAGLISTAAGLIETGIVAAPPASLVDSIFRSGIEEERKAAIFMILSKMYPYSELISYLPNIGWAYDLLNTGKDRFNVDELDTNILEYLKGHGFISSYAVVDDAFHIERQ